MQNKGQVLTLSLFLFPNSILRNFQILELSNPRNLRFLEFLKSKNIFSGMHYYRLLLLSLLLFGVSPLSAQSFQLAGKLLFYNTENFFDPADNPLTDDDDYTPEGARHWSYARMKHKYMNLARVIVAAADGKAPMIVGLAEVENDSCVYRLLHHTPLREWEYSSVITQSQDRRGINVALLYKADVFEMIGWESWRVSMPEGSKPTRDMLHAWGVVPNGDTLDVEICHLPSRLGGTQKSQRARAAAHKRLFMAIDSLQRVRKEACVVVMGDMNDAPNDVKLPRKSGLQNLMLPLERSLKLGQIPFGSHKYQGKWTFLDQIWVSKNMCGPEAGKLWVKNAAPVAVPFMLTEDNTHLGHRPLRSYYGYEYEGGYSDHLPVGIDLYLYFLR